MTLEGAINFKETDSYVIYTMNSATTGQYCVILPKNVNGVMNMLVDLHTKALFDGVSSGNKTKDQLVDELGKEYLNVRNKYSNSILVFPMIDEGMFQSAVVNNDKQKMFDEVKKIGAITSEIYRKLTAAGLDKQSIDQKIIIVEKDDQDVRFVAWLKEQMPNFVDGVLSHDLEPKVEPVNPFMGDSIFPSSEVKVEPVVNPIPVGNSIFDTPVPNTPVQPEIPVMEPVTPVVPVADPVVPTPSVESTPVDIFGIPSSVNGVVPTTSSSIVSEVKPELASNEPISSNTVVSSVSDPIVQPTPVADIPQPQPVNSVGLEGTTTFSPVVESQAPVQPTSVSSNVENNSQDETSEENKKSGGFVNLIILVVILIGVTIASIELGKYLYSVYGA